MFSKFSVKKPLTVYVSVLMVIILGFVSFSSMTPDLLPGINLPYAVVITTNPGATPEEIEEEISKPLEQAMATVENITAISSTSSDSVSMVMLEFNDSANMDAIVPDVREQINSVSGAWSDMVSTPYIIQINPNLLPVGVYSASYEGMDSIELTSFLNDTILSDLEGVTGVASVDVSGNVEEEVSVLISQEKIDILNVKIKNALDKQFAEAEIELNEQEQELEDGRNELESQSDLLDDSQSAVEEGQTVLAQETAKAQAELVDQKIEIENTIVELKSQISTANQSLPMLEQILGILVEVGMQYDDALENKATLETKLAELEAIEAPTTEQTAEIANIRIQLGLLDTTISALNATLSAYGYEMADLDEAIAQYEADIKMITDGVAQMEATIVELEKASVQITAGMEELNKQQLDGSMDLSASLSQIVAGQSALDSALLQMDSAQTQIDSAKDQIEEQREAAYKQATLDITMDMVSQILTAQNFSMPAGYITEDGVDYLVRVGEEAESLEDFAQLPILNTGLDDVGIVRLEDVADVFVSDNSAEVYAKVNGDDSLMLSFTKQSTFATKTVSDNLSVEFENLEEEFEGLSFAKLNDQGDYIDVVVGTVMNSLISGAVLAILILIFFLKDLRPTFIIACSIPISLLFAIVLMYFSGITLNIISLSGLAVGVGMLVDNSVVVIENIYRMRANGESALNAAVKGASQVAGAIVSSTLTTVCVFLPIVFIEGITRDLFVDMGLTVAYSLLASLIVALTLVPAMASDMLKKEKKPKSFILDKVTNGYERLAIKSLKHKWVCLGLSVVLLISSTAVALSRGFIFMPSMSGTQISVTVTGPEDATFEEMTELADEVSARIMEIDEVVTVGASISSGSTGSMSMMSMTGGSGSSASIYVTISENSSRKDSVISAEIVEKCADLDAQVEAQGAMDMGSMLTSMSGEGISVKVYGEDLDNLIAESDRLQEELIKVEGIAEVTTSIADANPEIRIVIDEEKAMEEGIMVAQVYAEVVAQIQTEMPSNTVNFSGEITDLVIYSEANQEVNVSDIEDMVISYSTMTGEKKEIELSKISNIVETKSLNSVEREDNKRVLTVSAIIEEGQNITIATDRVNSFIADYEPLTGNTLDVGGESDTIMEAITQLGLMLLLAVVIIYFIMVAQFQSFKSPFIVMFTIPLAFTGGFLALLVTGKEVSVIAMVGFVMLAGIIVNNGIVLIDYINILRLDGVEKTRAIVTAGVTRLRPILMTSLTTVLGLLFVAIGTGFGSEMMQPVAIVCIGGLLYATLMNLFVVPALYDIFNKKEMKKRLVD